MAVQSPAVLLRPRQPAVAPGPSIGNAVGTLAIARWVGSLDRVRLAQVLDGKTDPEDLHALYEAQAEAVNVTPIASARVAA